jgi:hypothetical protein
VGISLAILRCAEPRRVDLQQFVGLVRAVVFPRIEANLQLFEIVCRTAQAGEHLKFISLDVADFTLAEDALQLFVQRTEVALPELHHYGQSRSFTIMNKGRSYLPNTMLHTVREVGDHKRLSPEPVVTELLSQRVPGVIFEKLVVARAAVDFEAQFPFEPGGHSGLVFANSHPVSGRQAGPGIPRSDEAVPLGLT